ncbi:hypothetical protein NDU88_005831 [Pleurodeles waltl]|uniref:Uncharacterized protein n=1 Tax=Pleurodeles waltl TaxID=8319 RepID=A0AAV7UJ50_PLEWA|nr:hypothetical protein NDU88_005831 [Pleurodeles waltl]
MGASALVPRYAPSAPLLLRALPGGSFPLSAIQTTLRFLTGGLVILCRCGPLTGPLCSPPAPLSLLARALTVFCRRRPRQTGGPTSAGGHLSGSVVGLHSSGGLVPSRLLTASAEASLGRGLHLVPRQQRGEQGRFSRFPRHLGSAAVLLYVASLPITDPVIFSGDWVLIIVDMLVGPSSWPRSATLGVLLHRLQATPPSTA